jgi:hypothetical protein
MTGNRPKVATHSDYNRKILVGCGTATILLLMSIAALLILAFNHERYADRYPQSVAVSSHSNYRGLPTHFSWDNSYRTTDGFVSVYNWYSINFNLGAEARANSNCIVLEGSSSRHIVTRYTSVILCDTGDSRLVFVSRSTILK